jgi:hypothetical protein
MDGTIYHLTVAAAVLSAPEDAAASAAAMAADEHPVHDGALDPGTPPRFQLKPIRCGELSTCRATAVALPSVSNGRD